MDSISSHPEVLAVIVALPLFGVLAKVFRASFERIAKWYLSIAIFAVVIVMNSMFFPFIGGKDYFFRFSTELSLIFFLFAWAFEMRGGELAERLKTAFKKPLTIAVTAFAGAFLLATAFAYDAYAAFWSNYERGEGGFQMIHYWLFFILLVLLLRTERDWKNMFKFSLAAAGLMILYGIGGSLVLPGFIGPWAGSSNIPPSWIQKFISNRFQGSLGNAEYVGAYLLFTMFFTAYLWVKRKEAGPMKSLAHIGYAVLFLAFLLFFLLSQTRGAFLGFGIGVFALVLYFVIRGRGRFRKWSLAALAVVVILGGGVWTIRNSSFVENLPGGRLLQISTTASDVQTRFMVWGEAWQGFLERPVLGWGPENFTTVYDQFFNPGFYNPLNPGGSQTWFDRAHSVFFDSLSETGIVGFAAYVSIFVVFFWAFGRKKHGGANEPATATIVERGLVLALPVAYLVQGAAVFDVLPMYVSLFTFLGFAYYYFYERNHEPHEEHAHLGHPHHHNG